MSHKDNPAGRLYLLLQAVWDQPPNTAHGAAWRHAVKASESDEATFLRRMSAVYRLPGQIRALVSKIDALQSMPPVTRSLEKTERVLGHYYANKVEWFKKELTSNSLDILQMVSGNLSTVFAEPVIDDEQLQALLEEVTSLHQQVQDSADLTTSEKEHLLNILEVLGGAIRDIDVGGSDVLESAAHEALGEFVVGVAKESAPSVRTRVLSLIFTILNSVAPLTWTAAQIPPTVDWYFEKAHILQLERSNEDHTTDDAVDAGTQGEEE